MSETRFKCRAVNLIKRELPEAWIYHPSDKWVSGIPDIFILYKGVLGVIELKVDRNTTSRIQDVVLARIAKAGGGTWICRDSAKEDGMAQIKAVCSMIKMRAEAGCAKCGAAQALNHKEGVKP